MLVNVCTCVRFSVCVCVLRCGDKCQQQQQQQQPEASAEALTDTPLHTRYSLFACGVQMVKKSIVEKLVRMLDRHNFEFLVLMVTFLKRLSIFRENKDKVLCVCVFVFVCLCVCFCVFVCAFLCVCVCVFVFVCAFFLCVHVCVHVCVHTCVCIRVCMARFTHLSICSRDSTAATVTASAWWRVDGRVGRCAQAGHTRAAPERSAGDGSAAAAHEPQL